MYQDPVSLPKEEHQFEPVRYVAPSRRIGQPWLRPFRCIIAGASSRAPKSAIPFDRDGTVEGKADLEVLYLFRPFAEIILSDEDVVAQLRRIDEAIP